MFRVERSDKKPVALLDRLLLRCSGPDTGAELILHGFDGGLFGIVNRGDANGVSGEFLQKFSLRGAGVFLRRASQLKLVSFSFGLKVTILKWQAIASLLYFLTKMTAPVSASGQKRALTQMLRLARKLRDPEVYFSGVEVGPPIFASQHPPFWPTEASSLTDPPQSSIIALVAIAALQGEGTLCIDDQIYRLGPGKAVLIFPFQSHCYLNVDPRISMGFHRL